jgi:hypothetical protein
MSLSPIQQRAIVLLLSLPSQRAVAKKLGVAEETVSRWANDPIFKAELNRAADEAFAESLLVLKAGAVDSAVRLRREVRSKKPNRAAVYAASQLLTIATKFVETMELAAQVKALEEKLNGTDSFTE